MSEAKRQYRKKLTSHGLIYIAGEEVEMSVVNLSITGLLAELTHSTAIHSIEDLFSALKSSTKVDIYLPEMRLMGEADVVRADLIDGHIYIALEFCHLSHDVDNVLYKRKAYRKEIISPGQIVFNGKKYPFTARNVSVTGLMIHLSDRLEIPDGIETIFDFKRLNLRGKIKVIWSAPDEDGGTYMGLEYVQMEKTDIKGIPCFAPEEKIVLPKKN
jgi:hypothetical protein